MTGFSPGSIDQVEGQIIRRVAKVGGVVGRDAADIETSLGGGIRGLHDICSSVIQAQPRSRSEPVASNA
ncbi:MAG: hypothetical protein WKF82_00680 [Nocardioidaceae bacterium]